jgi:hypothetical protein
MMKPTKSTGRIYKRSPRIRSNSLRAPSAIHPKKDGFSAAKIEKVAAWKKGSASEKYLAMTRSGANDNDESNNKMTAKNN